MTSLILNLALSWTTLNTVAIGDVLPPQARFRCQGRLWLPNERRSVDLRRSEKAVRLIDIEETEDLASGVQEFSPSMPVEEQDPPALRLESSYVFNVAKRNQSPDLRALKTERMDISQEVAAQIYVAHQKCQSGETLGRNFKIGANRVLKACKTVIKWKDSAGKIFATETLWLANVQMMIYKFTAVRDGGRTQESCTLLDPQTPLKKELPNLLSE